MQLSQNQNIKISVCHWSPLHLLKNETKIISHLIQTIDMNKKGV